MRRPLLGELNPIYRAPRWKRWWYRLFPNHAPFAPWVEPGRRR